MLKPCHQYFVHFFKGGGNQSILAACALRCFDEISRKKTKLKAKKMKIMLISFVVVSKLRIICTKNNLKVQC